MKTLTLEIDETIYPQFVDFLKLFPENKCHVLEKSSDTPDSNPLSSIAEIFGLVKTPITATLEDIEQGIIAGAVNDNH